MYTIIDFIKEHGEENPAVMTATIDSDIRSALINIVNKLDGVTAVGKAFTSMLNCANEITELGLRETGCLISIIALSFLHHNSAEELAGAFLSAFKAMDKVTKDAEAHQIIKAAFIGIACGELANGNTQLQEVIVEAITAGLSKS